MKKLLFFGFVSVVFWSCGIDDGPREDFHFEILPIESVSLPDFLIANDFNRITYTYFAPSTCHSFNNLYYLENLNERTIAVVNLVTTSSITGLACETLIENEEERGFDFFATLGYDSYVFNFWQGEDENGKDIYLTVEVPVN